MSELVAVVSSPSLEKWDWRAPDRGIGGSETSAVKMAQGLHSRGTKVMSFAPIPEARHQDPSGLDWYDVSDFSPEGFGVMINYREPKVFDSEKPEGAKWWFVAQDVHYGEAMTAERRAKIDRYICLCPKHANFTSQMYPELHTEKRLFISSNGIDSSGIANTIRGIKRNPFRLTYASSPDRGLLLILENWFRIKERVPEAELHVFYGFHNMEKIVEMNGPGDWRFQFQKQLQHLLKQPGVVWRDRIGQKALWQEWAQTNVWFYPTDFPETSCITSMEAQACGAIPVVTNFWALEQNILGGYKFDGLPQQSPVIKSLMIEKVIDVLQNKEIKWDLPLRIWNTPDMGYYSEDDYTEGSTKREDMQKEAQETFDWSNIADQWENWIKEDLQ